jgi:hypothetical protein
LHQKQSIPRKDHSRNQNRKNKKQKKNKKRGETQRKPGFDTRTNIENQASISSKQRTTQDKKKNQTDRRTKHRKGNETEHRERARRKETKRKQK